MRLLPKTLLCALLLATLASQTSAGQQLVRLEVKTQEQFERLAALDLDVASSLRGSHVDVVIEPSDLDRIALLGFKYDVLDDDLQASLSSVLVDGLGEYHSYSEATAELLAAAADHSDIARAETIGTSYQGRPIWAIKISDNPDQDDPTEPDVLFVALHHARELMTVEVVLYLMHYLLDGYGVDSRVTHLVDDREIWIVPVLNVDGHVYMEGHYPLPIWRKNRKPTGVSSCVGVDINRNYGYEWAYDNVGSSPQSCSETYRGERAFSELETQAIRDLVLDESHNFTMAISYHSYGQLVLFPWGYTSAHTEDHDTFQVLADSMAAYNGYTAGPGYATIYSTNGDFDDWMYGDQVVTGGLPPGTPVTEKDRVFSYTLEVGTSFIPNPPGEKLTTIPRNNLQPNLLAIEYADNPNRVWPPDAPEMSDPTQLAGGGWQIRWTLPGIDIVNPAVAFELEEATGSAFAVDDMEGGKDSWEGNGFSLSQERSHSGAYSLHTGDASRAHSELAPAYPLHPTPGDSLGFRAWYSLASGYTFYAEASDDGGKSYSVLPGLLYPPGEAPRAFGGVLTGDSEGWAGVSLPLDQYAGKEVLLRLICNTSTVLPSGGIFIDDAGPIYTFKERHVLTSPLYTTKYDVGPSPEAMLFRARSIDMEGQHSPWSSAASVSAYQGVLRRLSVVPTILTSSAQVSFLAYDGVSGSETVPVRLEVFDAAGRLVRTLFNGRVSGDAAHEESWDGRADDGSFLPSGVYFVSMSVRGGRVADKVMLISR
jgi:carboxypeptidase T